MIFINTLWEAYKVKKRESDLFLDALTKYDSHLNIGARIARSTLVARLSTGRGLTCGEQAWLDAERARMASTEKP